MTEGRALILLLGAGVLLIAGLILRSPPKTYLDIARETLEDCRRQGDWSEWQTSPIETLERFCERASTLAAVQAYKRAHPAQPVPSE